MGSVVRMATPAGGRSSISVTRSDAGIDLVFARPGSPGASVRITVAQARLLADALRKEAE